jgi:hypothetical protein
VKAVVHCFRQDEGQHVDRTRVDRRCLGNLAHWERGLESRYENACLSALYRVGTGLATVVRHRPLVSGNVCSRRGQVSGRVAVIACSTHGYGQTDNSARYELTGSHSGFLLLLVIMLLTSHELCSWCDRCAVLPVPYARENSVPDKRVLIISKVWIRQCTQTPPPICRDWPGTASVYELDNLVTITNFTNPYFGLALVPTKFRIVWVLGIISPGGKAVPWWLWLACLPLAPRFAGSNPAEDGGF